MATFTTTDLGAQASDFNAEVTWGDGSIDVGTIQGGAGSFTVTGDHNYLEAGSYTVSVDVTARGRTRASAASTATVADAALTLSGGFGLGVIKSQLNTLTVATFTDANPAAPASDFSATINWGDGSSNTPGTISYSPDSVSSIGGSHVYAQDGSYTVTVTLTDADGATATTTSTAIVGDIYAGVKATLNVSSFQDAYTAAPASDFTATIDWGDGTTTSGVQATGSGGLFTLQAVTHTYAGDSVSQSGGVYTVTVTISDDGGSTLSGTGTVAVVRPPLTLFVGNTTTGPGSLSLSNAEVAAFTEPDTSDSSSEFSATINWGDGTSSSGTVTGGGGLFRVLGSHTYAYDGQYVIQVEVAQHWDALLAAAIGAGLVLAQPALPTIEGEHIVLGVSPEQLAGIGTKLPQFLYDVWLPGTNIDRRSIIWTLDKVDGKDVGKVTTIQVKTFDDTNQTLVWGAGTFLNIAAHVNLGLTYKRIGEAANAPVHRVQLFPISIVHLSVQNLVLKKNLRFNPGVGSRPDDPTGGSYVRIDTRGVRDYSYDKLKSEDEKVVDAELANGLVSFKATVLLRGAGASKREGVSAIHLGWLQTIVKTTFKVKYDTGSAEYRPMSGGSPLPPPWLDSNREKRPPNASVGSGGDSSFTRSSTEQWPGDDLRGGGQRRRVVSLDAPGRMFRIVNPASNTSWNTTEGGLSFVNHLTGYSTDAPFVYDVIAAVPWDVYFVGSNNGNDGWARDRTATKVNLPSRDYGVSLPAYGDTLDTFRSDGPTFFQATNQDRLVYSR
ncbi:MAG: PKD domain-containing protein [Planctomycetes bacterium]|nr:PKD domain-containing protein [Planctomycetota bacterium]